MPAAVRLDLLSARAQVLGHSGGRVAARVGEQGEELLAPEAAELVLRAQAVAQRAGDLDQGAVAGVVAVLIVDVLEAVEVDHRDRQLAAVAAGAADQPLEPGEDVAAVEQPGQRVLVEQRLEPAALADELLLQCLGAGGRAHAREHLRGRDRLDQQVGGAAPE